jgi:multiple sugar transport system permease protein
VSRAFTSRLLTLVTALAMVPFMFPFLWMMLNSLKNENDSIAVPPVLVFQPVLDNYRKILFESDFWFHFRNSLVIGLGSTAFGLFLGVPAAYSIARYRQGTLSMAILITRMLPGLSVLLPWFIWFRVFGLNDTFPGVMLTHVSITLPLVIWILVGFFEDFPRELEEAALIDGCSITGALMRIVLPLAVPGLVVAFILSFTFSWNNFLFTLVAGGPATRTLPVIAYSQIGIYRTDFGAMAASGIVLAVPVLILTLFVQRYLVRGLALGAIKG